MPFIVREIELSDFISHELTRVRFGPGISVLVGENGAGKSSIVDAIFYSLAQPRSLRGSKTNLVRANSRTGRARIRLVLEDSRTGERLVIVSEIARRQGPRSNSVEVWLETPGGGRKKIASKVEDARREIARRLGMDQASMTEVLERTVVLRQGMLNDIIRLFSEGSLRRKREFLDRIFGLEAYREARKRLSELAVSVGGREVRSPLVSRLEEDLEEVKDGIEKRRRELSKLREELLSLEKERERLSGELEEKRRTFEEVGSRLNEARQRLGEEKAKHQNLSSTLEEKRGARDRYNRMGCPGLEERIGELEKVLDELESIRVELGELENRYERLLVEKERVESELETLRELYRAVRTVIDRFGGKHPRKIIESYTALQAEKERLAREVARLEPERKTLAEDINSLKEYTVQAAKQAGIDESSPEKAIAELEKRAREHRKRAESLLEKATQAEATARSHLDKALDNEEKASLLRRATTGKCPLCGRDLSREEAVGLASRLIEEARKLRAVAKRLKVEAERMREEARRLEAEARRMERLASALRSRYDDFARRHGRLEEALKRLGEVEERLRTLRERLGVLERQVEDYGRNLREAAMLASILEKHGYTSDIGEDDARSVESRLRSVEARSSELSRSLEALKREIESLRSRASHVAGKKVSGSSSLASIVRDYRNRLAVLDRNRSACNVLRGKFEGLEKVEEEAAKALARVRELEEMVRELEEAYENAEKELEGVRQRLENVKQSIAAKGEEIRVKEQHVRELEEERRSLEEQLWAARVLKWVSDVLNSAPELLYRRKLWLLQSMVSRMLAAFNTKYVEAHIARSERDIRFLLTSREGIRVDLAQISGGEQTAFGLALVLALNKLLAGNVGFIVLDEPTAHLDSEKRAQIAEILRELRGERGLVDQVIIVSHERHLIDAADAVYHVEYVNGRSVVRQEGLPDTSVELAD